MNHPASILQSCSRAFRFVFGLFGATALAFSLQAAEPAPAEGKAGDRAPEKKRFDIPSGDAFTTLKQFATQSGEQLIYKVDTLEGIQTVAVRGRFTAREALGRMLAKTNLSTIQDRKVGTLSIVEKVSSNDRDVSGTTHSDQPSTAKKKSLRP